MQVRALQVLSYEKKTPSEMEGSFLFNNNDSKELIAVTLR